MIEIAFAVYGSNPFFLPYKNALARIFGFGEGIPASIEPFRAFLWGPIGASIASSYILLAFIAKYPFLRKERWARNAVIVAFGIWVVLDSSVCIAYGVYFQVYLVNGFSILIKALLLIFTWNEFSK